MVTLATIWFIGSAFVLWSMATAEDHTGVGLMMAIGWAVLIVIVFVCCLVQQKCGL